MQNSFKIKDVKKVRSAIKISFFQFNKFTFDAINDSVSNRTYPKGNFATEKMFCKN